MRFISVFIVLVISINLHAEERKIEALYALNNIKGSILIESADGSVEYQYNVDDEETLCVAQGFI